MIRSFPFQSYQYLRWKGLRAGLPSIHLAVRVERVSSPVRFTHMLTSSRVNANICAEVFFLVEVNVEGLIRRASINFTFEWKLDSNESCKRILIVVTAIARDVVLVQFHTKSADLSKYTHVYLHINIINA